MPDHITKHYNAHRPRQSDQMLPIRIYHNFVKSVLIHRAYDHLSAPERDARPSYRVLDLCSGNGGDIGKHKHQNISYYLGIDVAGEACRRATDRLSESGLNGDVLSLNAFTVTCGAMLENMRPFDLCSCQFALHYCLSDERTARTAIQNVSLALKPGGVFIGTIPDGEHLDNARKLLGTRFGDKYHTVKFTSDSPASPASSASSPVTFGDAYLFSLRGAVDDLEEYVIRKDTLVPLCSECDLELLSWTPFTKYGRHDDPALWQTMGVTEAGAKMTRFYTSFMFVKRG
jgi:mRNA (guanine-N7-)-methyltransferase